MDFNIIKKEILDSKYSGMTDQQIVDKLIANDIPVLGIIEISDLLLWSARNDAIRKIQAHVNDIGSIGSFATAALYLFSSGVSLNLGNPEVKRMFDAFVEAKIFTQEEEDELLKVATTYTNRANQLDIPEVGLGDIIYGRKI